MVSFVLLHAEVKSLATREESIVSYHTLRSTRRPLVHLKNKHGVIQQHISAQIGPEGLAGRKGPTDTVKSPNPVSSLDDMGESQGKSIRPLNCMHSIIDLSRAL